MKVSSSYVMEKLETGEENPDLKYKIAACLVKDAKYTRIHIPYKLDLKSIKLYELYYNTFLIGGYYFFLWLNLAMIFIETPASFQGIVGILPYEAVLCIHLLCIIFFFLRFYHHLMCADWEKFWKNYINIATLVILILMVIDIFIFTIMKYCAPHLHRVQWSRFLRPILCASFPENFKIRAALNNIRGTLVDISVVFSLFLFMLLFFSLISLQFLINEKLYWPSGEPYLRDFLSVLFELYVLVTTSNSPDVIIPAYEKNSSYILIYLCVCIVCNWLFMGIVIASVYNAYKIHLGNAVIHNVRMKKSRLLEAFRFLKSPETNKLPLANFLIVMQNVDPKSTEDRNRMIFKLLDTNNTNNLVETEFTRLTEYLNVHFEEIPMNYNYFYKHLPALYWCYMSKFNQMFIPIIRSIYTKLFFEFLVLVNAVTMIVLNGTSYEIPLEWTFTFVFVFEIIIRMFAAGVNLYFHEPWNIFDFIVITLAVLSFVVEQIIIKMIGPFENYFLRLLLAFRVLRLLKIITVIQAYKLITHCIIILLPSLFAYAAIQLSIYYIYVCIGMEAFGNRYFPPPGNNYKFNTSDCGNKKLVNTAFWLLHYCILNYNSAADGFLLMTILTVSNNWHVLLQGAALVTNRWTILFFVSIHIFCVILVMNIVLAFIIDAYMMEVDQTQSEFDSNITNRLTDLGINADIELKKIGLGDFGVENFDLSKEMLNKAFPNPKQEGPTCFRIDDSAVKDMETLLNRMFQDDIDNLHNEHFGYTLRRSLKSTLSKY